MPTFLELDSADERYIELRGGLVTPAEPFLLLLSLEERGFRLSTENGGLVVPGPLKLTDDDYRLIKQWKSHLLLLMEYQPSVCA